MARAAAPPMVGGMVSSTVLTLVVTPAAYALWRERQLAGDADVVEETSEAVLEPALVGPPVERACARRRPERL